MEIYNEKKDKIVLFENDFIISGGEANIYRKGNIIYKIQLDINKALTKSKLDELSVLSNDKRIILPQELVYNLSGQSIGFTMKYLDNTIRLESLRDNNFKETHHISKNEVLEIIKEIQDLIEFIHSKDIIVVDLHKRNFLIDNKNFKKIYIIDTDSFQTKSFPTASIVKKIKDPYGKPYTTLTDWYSFAILSFELLIGAHPFSGLHPEFKSTRYRMKHRKSLFNEEVEYPQDAYNLEVIPEYLKNWFYSLFEEGKRSSPPKILTT